MTTTSERETIFLMMKMHGTIIKVRCVLGHTLPQMRLNPISGVARNKKYKNIYIDS